MPLVVSGSNQSRSAVLQRRARRRPCTITSQRYALLWPSRRCKFVAGHSKPAARASMRHYVNTLISTAVVGRICSDGATYLRKRLRRTAQNLPGHHLDRTACAVGTQKGRLAPKRTHAPAAVGRCRRSTPNVTSVDNFRWLCTAHHASPLRRRRPTDGAADTHTLLSHTLREAQAALSTGAKETRCCGLGPGRAY